MSRVQRVLLAHGMVCRIYFRMEFVHLVISLTFFVNSNNIPSLLSTVVHVILIDLQRLCPFFCSLTALSAIPSVSEQCEVLLKFCDTSSQAFVNFTHASVNVSSQSGRSCSRSPEAVGARSPNAASASLR